MADKLVHGKSLKADVSVGSEKPKPRKGPAKKPPVTEESVGSAASL